MIRARRAIKRGTLGALILISVTACTPGVANAWRLEADGSVSVVSCRDVRASRFEVEYLSAGVAVASAAAEGEERSFGDGHPVVMVPEGWLTAVGMTSLPEWDAVRATLAVAPFPAGTSHAQSRRDDPSALVETFTAEIPRSDLRVGEWVWDRQGSTCDILPESDGAPVYTGALPREAYEQLLSEYPDLDSLAGALVDLRQVAPILAFQALLVDEIGASALPGEDPSLTLARIRPTAAPSALLAAELAVTRLGFTWDESAVRAGETD